MLKRWSMWLAIVFCVLGILSAAPGLTEAPTAQLRILATVGVVRSALIILLVVLPSSRRAYIYRPSANTLLLGTDVKIRPPPGGASSIKSLMFVL